ncbi:MAG: ImmA/IrrE family metallo-endopeptidase [Chthoniobacterales bacterium]
MPSSQRKAIVVARADDLLAELQIQEPREIDIERIAIFKGADVRYAPLHGMDGCLVRKNDAAIITVRHSLRYEGQKRFVIGHELGHFFLHPETRQIETVDDKQTNNWSEKQETEEYEANLFAAELLMPKRFIETRIVGQEPSFDLIKRLAEGFQTTLTATAAQFVLTTTEECVLISSENRHRLWFIPSKGFSFSLLEDDYVHGHSCTAEVNKTMRCSRSADIEASYWLEGFRGDHKSCITEDAMFFTTLGRALTLLWIHDAI